MHTSTPRLDWARWATTRLGGANIALGGSAGSALTSGNDNIAIGNVGVAGESGKIRIGTSGKRTGTFVAGISGVAVAGGVGVMVNSNEQFGTVVSCARYKDAIKPMEKASEAILALQPVTLPLQEGAGP